LLATRPSQAGFDSTQLPLALTATTQRRCASFSMGVSPWPWRWVALRCARVRMASARLTFW